MCFINLICVCRLFDILENDCKNYFSKKYLQILNKMNTSFANCIGISKIGKFSFNHRLLAISGTNMFLFFNCNNLILWAHGKCNHLKNLHSQFFFICYGHTLSNIKCDKFTSDIFNSKFLDMANLFLYFFKSKNCQNVFVFFFFLANDILSCWLTGVLHL